MRRSLLCCVVLFAGSVSLLRAQTPAPADTNALAIQAYQAGKYEEAKSLFDSVLATDPNNASARTFLRMIAVKIAGEQKAQAAFESVILPKINFNDTSLKSSVEFLSQSVTKVTNGSMTASFVWLVPQDVAENKKITLQLTDIPFTEALRYIGDMAGVKFVIQEHAIEVVPADK